MRLSDEEFKAIPELPQVKLKAPNDYPWEWHTTFIGQYQQHSYWLFQRVDQIIMANPQIRSIIELGTARGALSLALGLWGLRLEIPVYTYEYKWEMVKPIFPVLDSIGVNCYEEDVFSKECIKGIKTHINKEPTFFICDNGEKTDEFDLYAPLLPKGSIIAAHDWTAEIDYHHVQETVEKCKLVPFQEDKWLEKNVQFATWIKP